MIDQTKLYLRFRNGKFDGLALDVNIQREGEDTLVCFFDTNRGRIFRGEVQETEGGFKVKGADNEWEIVVATRELFDTHARRWGVGSLPTFKHDEDLHEWYRRQFL